MAFYIGVYAYAFTVHIWGDQLLPQLLMEQFDTFPIQCRHIEHMHEGVWFRKIIRPIIIAISSYKVIIEAFKLHKGQRIYGFIAHQCT